MPGSYIESLKLYAPMYKKKKMYFSCFDIFAGLNIIYEYLQVNLSDCANERAACD